LKGTTHKIGLDIGAPVSLGCFNQLFGFNVTLGTMTIKFAI
jgi:hypothetical protein